MHRKDSGDSAAWWAIAIITTVLVTHCSADAQVALTSTVIPDVNEVYPAPRRADRYERRLIELVAKVSFNEALDSYDDLALIWQVVEGHGDTARERAFWLGSHSPCVSGHLTQDQARLRPGNCRWTRNLMADGRRPRGWDRELHGHWSQVRERWLAHIPRVRDFVLGLDRYRPCRETPQTWDGVRYGRDRVAPEGSVRRILECQPSYTSHPDEEGLHNFAVRREALSNAS